MSSLSIFTRILIVGNLVLLVALIIALGRGIDKATAPEEKPARTPARQSSAEKPERMSEDEIVSALPKARRSSRTNRLNSLDLLIARVKRTDDYSTLRRLHSELLGRERAGYDTKIERGIVQHRLGEVDGARATRSFYSYDTDRAEYAHGTILEGWAHAAPNEALNWWQKLPRGNKRQSLVTPLVQGFLSAQGTDWRSIAKCLTSDELSSCVLVLMEHAQGTSQPGALIDLLEEEFASTSAGKRNRIGVRINDALLADGDLESLVRWHKTTNADGWLISDDRTQQVVRKIGAVGGPRGLDWAAANSEGDMMRVALGWVKENPQAAAGWLQKNPLAEGADQVAFQLAIDSVVDDQNQACEWAQFITDEDLAETIDGIISSYEER